jgi:hypothetical protein
LRAIALICELTGEEPTEDQLADRLLKHHDFTSEHERGEERSRFKDLVMPLFWLLRLRAQALVQGTGCEILCPELMKALRQGPRDSWRYRDPHDGHLRAGLGFAIDAALCCSGDTGDFIDEVADSARTGSGKVRPSPGFRWRNAWQSIRATTPEHFACWGERRSFWK